MQSTIDNYISNYINVISNKYNIDKETLILLWNNRNTSLHSELYNLSVKELKQQCKNLGVKSTGNKQDLINNIMNKGTKNDNEPKCKPVDNETKSNKTENKGKKKIKNSELTDKSKKDNTETKSKVIMKNQSNVIQKIENTNFLKIRRNKFDNYEHIDTSFVFHKIDKNVIGKQLEDGTICTLTKEDIKLINETNIIGF